MADEQGLETVETRQPFWRRHRVLRWTLIVLLMVLIAVGVTVDVLLHRAEPMLRERIVAGLENHFHARVELDSFHVSLASGLWAEGRGLRIWPPADVQGVTVPGGNPDEPLISLDEFRFHAPLHYKRGEPIHVSTVQLKGLKIDMPPRSSFTHAAQQQSMAGPANAGAGADTPPPQTKQPLLRFEIGSIVCTDTQLTLETSKPGKLPLTFEIASLKLTDIQPGSAMKFVAQLTNAKPVGIIHTTGSFGPWSVSDPGESPVSGEYKFDNANLGDFKGIAGTLSSTGNYDGTLRDLTVDGVTDTPNFQLTNFGTPVPLHTEFHAKVDATNGDTWLQPVHATLGKSHFTVQGEVVRVPDNPGKPSPGAMPASTQSLSRLGIKGHDISLNVDIERGRMEDFLQLTSKSGAPILTGSLNMKALLQIPPGKEPVHERMKLKGKFTLDDAQFTDAKIQQKIGDLSLRGQGQPKEARKSGAGDDVRSAMQSDFQMAAGVITLPDLEYTVPGADINLNGTYGMVGGALNFVGTARMQATVSQMVGGWKGFLLKPADRFFKKDGAGTKVAIHIDGTREHPQFGVDIKGMKGTSAENPEVKQEQLDQQQQQQQKPQ